MSQPAKDKTVNTLITEYNIVFPNNDPVLAVLLEKYVTRADFGFKKYGVTTDERTDISLRGWFQHLQEELMDATVYMTRILRDIPKDHPGHWQLCADLHNMMGMALYATASMQSCPE